MPFSEIFDPTALTRRTLSKSTVAAVPRMVGATTTHLQRPRRLVNDDGWIRTLREEAENERMHRMTLVGIARPAVPERLLIVLAKWLFYVGFFGRCLVSRRTAHRLVGYFEEEGDPQMVCPPPWHADVTDRRD